MFVGLHSGRGWKSLGQTWLGFVEYERFIEGWVEGNRHKYRTIGFMHMRYCS